MNGRDIVTARASIAMAIAFNLPYAVLTATFDYPDILRQPPEIVLARFAEGGWPLIATWYAFGIIALLLVPLSIALAMQGDRLARQAPLAIAAAIFGSLAGLTQAIGLLRWVFVVPLLAMRGGHGSETLDAGEAQSMFVLIHAYGGVAIGEHIGQLLTAGFVGMMAAMQRREGLGRTARLGDLTALAIAIGTGEGLAIAFGRSGDLFSLFTIAGFLGLTVWLIATGMTTLRRSVPRLQPTA